MRIRTKVLPALLQLQSLLVSPYVFTFIFASGHEFLSIAHIFISDVYIHCATTRKDDDTHTQILCIRYSRRIAVNILDRTSEANFWLQLRWDRPSPVPCPISCWTLTVFMIAFALSKSGEWKKKRGVSRVLFKQVIWIVQSKHHLLWAIIYIQRRRLLFPYNLSP